MSNEYKIYTVVPGQIVSTAAFWVYDSTPGFTLKEGGPICKTKSKHKMIKINFRSHHNLVFKRAKTATRERECVYCKDLVWPVNREKVRSRGNKRVLLQPPTLNSANQRIPLSMATVRRVW